MVGTEVELKYNYGWYSTRTKKAIVEKCGYLDVAIAGEKMYFLNVDNGWVKGWFYHEYVDGGWKFLSKDDIKTSCITESMDSFDRPHPEWEEWD